MIARASASDKSCAGPAGGFSCAKLVVAAAHTSDTVRMAVLDADRNPAMQSSRFVDGYAATIAQREARTPTSARQERKCKRARGDDRTDRDPVHAPPSERSGAPPGAEHRRLELRGRRERAAECPAGAHGLKI